jgi:hypothetical protein
MDFLLLIAAAGFKQQHFDGWVLAKPIGKNASGGPGANDDVVINSLTPETKEHDERNCSAKNDQHCWITG